MQFENFLLQLDHLSDLADVRSDGSDITSLSNRFDRAAGSLQEVRIDVDHDDVHPRRSEVLGCREADPRAEVATKDGFQFVRVLAVGSWRRLRRTGLRTVETTSDSDSSMAGSNLYRTAQTHHYGTGAFTNDGSDTCEDTVRRDWWVAGTQVDSLDMP